MSAAVCGNQLSITVLPELPGLSAEAWMADAYSAGVDNAWMVSSCQVSQSAMLLHLLRCTGIKVNTSLMVLWLVSIPQSL